MTFSEVLLDHFQWPRNVGEIEQADAESEGENPVCGDRLHVWLRIRGDTIEELRWRAEGCAPAIAAASVMSELVQGMSVERALSLDRETLTDSLGGLPAGKAHATHLAVATLRQALSVQSVGPHAGNEL